MYYSVRHFLNSFLDGCDFEESKDSVDQLERDYSNVAIQNGFGFLRPFSNFLPCQCTQ